MFGILTFIETTSFKTFMVYGKSQMLHKTDRDLTADLVLFECLENPLESSIVLELMNSKTIS